ncbi:MAG: SGNH/GDSL hydrolase family protein [Anaerolineales bacterium]|nr:SGNH/GDSL hydrolase family protein [Anaerolineales bacterium]
MRDPMPPEPVRFLALGDSYTIGESVAPEGRWPVQLVAALRAQGYAVTEPEIIARTGWTTDELDVAITAADPRGPYDLVSLLIGVNNQYRGYELESYRTEFSALLERAIELAGGDPERVVVLSIPDWGVTPFAAGRDRDQVAAEIDAFNAANRQISQAAGVDYLDITPISRQAVTQADLIAADGLHPSAQMYALWVDALLPTVTAILAP